MTEKYSQGPNRGVVGSVPSEERRRVDDHNNYFNAQFDANPVYLDPGAVDCLSDSGKMLVATVGSGVLVTLYDHELKAGAMGYVLLPDPILECFPFFENADPALVAKAFEPIENCVGEMKRRGAGKNRIKIRLFGGNLDQDDVHDRGIKNAVFVQEYLFRQGLAVFNADLGGGFVRRVHFFPTTGRTIRRILKRKDDFQDMKVLESDFNKKITSGA